MGPTSQSESAHIECIVCATVSNRSHVGHVKGPNMARGGVNSLFKNSTNSLEQEASK